MTSRQWRRDSPHTLDHPHSLLRNPNDEQCGVSSLGETRIPLSITLTLSSEIQTMSSAPRRDSHPTLDHPHSLLRNPNDEQCGVSSLGETRIPLSITLTLSSEIQTMSSAQCGVSSLGETRIPLSITLTLSSEIQTMSSAPRRDSHPTLDHPHSLLRNPNDEQCGVSSLGETRIPLSITLTLSSEIQTMSSAHHHSTLLLRDIPSTPS
ncbi:hypothetical protein BLNAU_22787 [Blattamonas nauphoetae]|uniref:Uncharacterized protein n=1 Tax=Blattamonas nauphoetae TaxID=2049346 RepID=A0ABQ9WV40_9EUKA|nr:hypothetical protein BLNAU_22787 [Blattamonas nauphoetae]